MLLHTLFAKGLPYLFMILNLMTFQKLLIMPGLNTNTFIHHKQEKKVHLQHLSQDCFLLLKNAEAIIDVNIIEGKINQNF
jgi:hypothetical protein